MTTLARRAFRRPVDADDLRPPLALYREARAEGDFDAGIEMALGAVLVSPQFLFRIERDPADAAAGAAYRIGAARAGLAPVVLPLEQHPGRRAARPGDARRAERARGARAAGPPDAGRSASRSLVDNFAGQWLHLRNLESITPDLRLFPDFDDNLRQAFRRETELLFESVVREDRSVLDLLKSDHAYLNERLARHYGIPHVYGSQFRRVALGDGQPCAAACSARGAS